MSREEIIAEYKAFRGIPVTKRVPGIERMSNEELLSNLAFETARRQKTAALVKARATELSEETPEALVSSGHSRFHAWLQQAYDRWLKGDPNAFSPLSHAVALYGDPAQGLAAFGDTLEGAERRCFRDGVTSYATTSVRAGHITNGLRREVGSLVEATDCAADVLLSLGEEAHLVFSWMKEDIWPFAGNQASQIFLEYALQQAIDGELSPIFGVSVACRDFGPIFAEYRNRGLLTDDHIGEMGVRLRHDFGETELETTFRSLVHEHEWTWKLAEPFVEVDEPPAFGELVFDTLSEYGQNFIKTIHRKISKLAVSA